MTQDRERLKLRWVWHQMIRRCTIPSHPQYRHYGGRGITVCDRWRGEDGFENFLEDMGPRRPDLQLDRVDNDGNYEPDNCRWATRKQQMRNKSNHLWVAINGSEMVLAAAAEMFGHRRQTVRHRVVRLGWSLIDALLTPVNVARGEYVAEHDWKMEFIGYKEESCVQA